MNNIVQLGWLFSKWSRLFVDFLSATVIYHLNSSERIKVLKLKKFWLFNFGHTVVVHAHFKYLNLKSQRTGTPSAVIS
jgi:hypothetical protein